MAGATAMNLIDEYIDSDKLNYGKVLNTITFLLFGIDLLFLI